jgi:hypothetical protein
MARSDNKTKRTTIVVFFHRNVRMPIGSEQFRIFDPELILAFQPNGNQTVVRLTKHRISTGARIGINDREGQVTSCRRENDRFQLVVEGICPSDAEGLASTGLIQVLQ